MATAVMATKRTTFKAPSLTAKEIITISISLIALATSIFSIALQYMVRDDLRYRIADVIVSAREPEGSDPVTYTASVVVTVYNGGNRSAALEQASLRLLVTDYDELQAKPPKSCWDGPSLYLTPVSGSSHNTLSVSPSIIGREGIFSRSFDYDVFASEKREKELRAEGLLCLEMSFSSANGKTDNVQIPLGNVRIYLNREYLDQGILNSTNVDLNTRPYLQWNEIRRIF